MMPEYATQELEKVSKSKKTVIQSMCKIFKLLIRNIVVYLKDQEMLAVATE